MLEVLIQWILCLITAIAIGRFSCQSAGKILQIPSQFSVWIYFWVGLAGVSLVLNVVSFDFPINSWMKWGLWFLFSLATWYQRKWLLQLIHRSFQQFSGWHFSSLFLAFAGTIIAMLKAAGLPEIFDEGAYHLPLIRMWEMQGMVPGVANLNGHYGLNSTWHLLSAWSNLEFLPQFHLVLGLNGLVAAVLAWFAGSRIEIIRKGKARISDWIAIFLPFMVFRNLLSSPATDIPAIICTWFIFILWLQAIEDEESPATIWPLLIILPVWTVMLKASSAPLLLIPFGLIILCLHQKHQKTAYGFLSICILLLLPWIFQNWLLTGYAIFPVKATAIGHPNWQVPLESIDKKFYLEQFGSFAPPKSFTFSWFQSWLKAHNRDTRIILAFTLASLVSGLVYFIRQPRGRNWMSVYLYVVLIACLLTWFLTITEPRYGFGALVFSALFPIALFLQRISEWKAIFKQISLLALAGLGLNTFKTIKEYEGSMRHIIFPAERPLVSMRQLQCGNFIGNTPLYYQGSTPLGKPVFCWDCPFPCIPKEGIGDSMQINNARIGPYNGFIFKPLIQSDQ